MRAEVAKRRRRWQLGIAIALIVVGVGGTAVRSWLAARAAMITVSEEVRALLDVEGSRWRFTFAAADASGLPVLAVDGVMDWRTDQCTTSGRVLAGVVGVNPASDPADISGIIDAAETGQGVGRIYVDDTEHVELADGSDGGRVPVPWLEPIGAAAVDGFCDQVLLHLSILQPPALLSSAHPIDVAVVAQDAEENATRWVAAYDDDRLQTLRIAGAGEVEVRTEIVQRPTGRYSIVARSVTGSANEPSIIVAQLNLEPIEPAVQVTQ